MWSTKKTVKDVAEPKALLSPAVVLRAGAGVRENLIGVSHELEALLSIFGRVDVWVQFPRELAIGLLDLIRACVRRDPQDLIVVAQELPSRSLVRYLATALTDAMFPE